MFHNRLVRSSGRGSAVARRLGPRRAPRFNRIIGILLTTVVTTVVAATMTGQPAYATSPGKIKNYRSAMCLQPVPDSFQSIFANGVRIAQMPCDGSTAQLWRTVLLGQGRNPLFSCSFSCPEISPERYYYVINDLTGLCMDVRDASTANGAVIQQFACNGGGSEKWFKHTDGSGRPQYVNARTAKCLDVPYATTSASYIWQYRCTAFNEAQEFTFPL